MSEFGTRPFYGGGCTLIKTHEWHLKHQIINLVLQAGKDLGGEHPEAKISIHVSFVYSLSNFLVRGTKMSGPVVSVLLVNNRNGLYVERKTNPTAQSNGPPKLDSS